MADGIDFVAAMNSVYLLEHPEIALKARARRLADLRARTVLVMAIKPKYAKAIYEGRKNWEFRKAPPPLFRSLLVYESAPVSMITGEIIFTESVTGIPMAVMDIVRTNKCYTRNRPGISLADLAAYAGKKLVTALRVWRVKRFDAPVKLNARPPQNWGRFLLPPAEPGRVLQDAASSASTATPTPESEVSNG
ncbi:MAG: hypothetical protein IIZ06_01045 [Kiritimatiellae bacterium]|nr:hypothetical protein [Kiritimatiellia bacterium]